MRVLLLLALFATPVFAQKVVILEIDGDRQNKLRAQIERAVRDAGTVEVISLKTYRAAAKKRKMTGAAAMTSVGVARTARSLKFDVAVGGELVKGKYHVVIYDRAGEPLWLKTLALEGALLSDDFASKLARAIAAAGEQGAQKAQPEPEPEAEEPEVGLDLSQTDASGQYGVVTVTGGRVEPEHRDEDLEGARPRTTTSDRVPVPIFRLGVMAATTFRSQCLRPGVKSCREYDSLQVKPVGGTVEFTARVPYWGLFLAGEVFPLARLDRLIAQGFGLLFSFQYGSSPTRIVEETPQGQGPEQTINNDDIGFMGQLTWRFHFQMGLTPGGGVQPLGWAGLRGGVATRSFIIDRTATVALPSSERGPHGVIGLDVAVPILQQLRPELAVNIFISPRPADDTIIGYGNLNDSTGGVISGGFGLEAGLAGELLGSPGGFMLGYTARWRFASYTDEFKGQGQKWTVCDETQCGGAGEEAYHSITFGLTAAF